MAGATIYEQVPFTRTNKRQLSGQETTTLDSLWSRAHSVRNSMIQRPPGQWTWADRNAMLSSSAPLELSEEELALLREVLQRCLAEFANESAIHPFLAGVERKDMVDALQVLTAP
jgi:hypothetical protein